MINKADEVALSLVLLLLLIVEAQVDASIDDGHEVGDKEEYHNVHGLEEDAGHIKVVRDLYELIDWLG